MNASQKGESLSTSTSIRARATPGAPKTSRGARTRARILKAAEQTIGTLGYHQAGITDITQAAGVAQGTLYCYFSGKEEILRELVRDMGHELRAHLAAETRNAVSRLDAEEKGLKAFLHYLGSHPNLYRILQQAQFVSEEIYRDYYEAFARNYSDMLTNASRKGEIRPGNDDVRAWALMGLSNFLGLRYALWGHDLPIEDVVSAATDLLRHGLSLDSKERPIDPRS